MKTSSVHSREHGLLIEMLKALRLDAGLPQSEVAVLVKRPQTYVSAIEVGDRGVTVFQLRELVLACGGDFPEFIAELERRIRSKRKAPPTRRRQPRRTSPEG